MVLQNSKLGLYQRWLREKYRKVETIYYQHIDELTQFIGDLDLPGVNPEDFTLTDYSFVKSWEDGQISSAKAYEIMEMMDVEQAAKAKITKRLYNYMLKYDVLDKYIKPTIAELDKECVVEMMKYLEMLKTTFKKMAEVDRRQMAVTWVQQVFKSDKPDELLTQEMSLNQTIRHIDTFIDQSAGQRFYLKDQILIFDEEIGFHDRVVHWLFAPRQYIELMRVLFNVKEALGDEEIQFLKGLIKDVE